MMYLGGSHAVGICTHDIVESGVETWLRTHIVSLHDFPEVHFYMGSILAAEDAKDFSVGSFGTVPSSSAPVRMIIFCWILVSRCHTFMRLSDFSSCDLMDASWCLIIIAGSFFITDIAPADRSVGFPGDSRLITIFFFGLTMHWDRVVSFDFRVVSS